MKQWKAGRVLSRAWPILKATFAKWSEDRAPRMGASLSFYTVVSLPSLLIVTIGITGMVLGTEEARTGVLEQVSALMGEQTATAIRDMLNRAKQPSSGGIGTALGVLILLFGASGVFGELQDALNTIWGVASKPGQGLLWTIRTRFISMVAVVGTGFLLLVSLVISAWLAAAGKWLAGLLPGPEAALQILNFAVSFAAISGLFTIIYKILPDIRLTWRDVWPAGTVTALLFTLGKMVIGIYLGKSDVASGYGAAGSLVMLLLWVYYSAQILYFGAEFAYVHATRYGSLRHKSCEPIRGADKEAVARAG